MGISQHHRHPLDLAIGFETIDEALLAGIFHRLGGDQGHLLWRQGEFDVEQHAGAQLTVRLGMITRALMFWVSLETRLSSVSSTPRKD